MTHIPTRGYRRIRLQFNELARLLIGNSGRPFESDFPEDLVVHHVIEDSRAIEGVSVVVSSKVWKATDPSSVLPDLSHWLLMRSEKVAPDRMEQWIEKIEIAKEDKEREEKL